MRNRFFGRLLGVLFLAAATLPAFAGSAKACDISNHCYGEVLSSPANIDGVYAAVSPRCIGVPANAFATDEVWLTTADGQYWVETGFIMNFAIINGLPAGLSGFFFDSRPNGGGHGHVLVANPSLVASTAWIGKIAANTYQVQFGNAAIGDSVNNSMTPAIGIVGSEITNPTGQSYSYDYWMETRENGVWRGSLLNPERVANPPQVQTWVQTNSSMYAGVPCH